MRHDLLASLKDWCVENRASLERRGASIKVFESPMDRDKRSYGVSLEYGDRIVFVTVWSSGEFQFSSIDLSVDENPKEEYRENPSAQELLAIIESRGAWIFGSPSD